MTEIILLGNFKLLSPQPSSLCYSFPNHLHCAIPSPPSSFLCQLDREISMTEIILKLFSLHPASLWAIASVAGSLLGSILSDLLGRRKALMVIRSTFLTFRFDFDSPGSLLIHSQYHMKLHKILDRHTKAGGLLLKALRK